MKLLSTKLSKIWVGMLSALVLSTTLTALPAQAEPAPPTATPSIHEGALVAFDANGTLWVYNGDARIPDAGIVSRTRIGSGWTVMRDLKIADWNQDQIQDIVAVGKNGNLYLYYGKPMGGFTRITLGTGWASYDISVGKWKETDQYPSIIAANLQTHTLYNYPNLSGARLSPRVAVGQGWTHSLTHHLTDFDNDGKADIIAQQGGTGNMLWYKTDGNGNFNKEPIIVVGRGWHVFNEVESASTYPGMLARTDGGVLYYYQLIDGRWLPRQKIGTGWNGYTIAGY